MINFGKFEAQPKVFVGRPMTGVEDYPGFHTSINPEVAYTYAQAKINTDNLKHNNFEINDYPIIVTLDMNELKRLPDYDTTITCRRRYDVRFSNFFRKGLFCGDRKGTIARFQRFFLQEYEKEKILLQNPKKQYKISSIEWLFAYHMQDWYHYPFVALMKLIEKSSYSLTSFIEKLFDHDFSYFPISKMLSDEELMSLTKQYRYIDDVEEERIVEIDYVKPLYKNIITEVENLPIVDKKRQEEFIAKLENNNFEYILRNQTEPEWTIVYSWKNPKQHKSPRIEYHGTTYRNLIAAAPKLAKQLPIPPKPFVL